MAKIDVLLPVKNGMDFLAASLDSVCAQTFQDWRLIVLDHGSTDGSRELAEAYGERDPRVQVRAFPQAQGLAGLLNCGLDIADCDLVMRHDADDVCLPERMALTLAAFAARPDCVAIGGQAEIIDAAGAHLGVMDVPLTPARVTAASLFRNPVAHPTATMRLGELNKLGARYGVDFLKVLPEQERLSVPSLAEDYFLFGQLAILGRCANVPQQLIRYRWHGNNVSAARFFDQMTLSLRIARNLARALAVTHGVAPFDPAPFCNHGGLLLDVGGQTDFAAEYAAMEASLLAALGDSADLRRELRYRKAVATRNPLALLWRYHQFRAGNTPETGEWNAVRGWLLRGLPRQRRLSAATA